jgi:hypothetical protein
MEINVVQRLLNEDVKVQFTCEKFNNQSLEVDEESKFGAFHMKKANDF